MRAAGEKGRYVAHDVESGLTEYPFIQRSIECTHLSLCADSCLEVLQICGVGPRIKIRHSLPSVDERIRFFFR